ncbi:MAG TPA: MarR family transcriptional regulator [Cytophagaceae bacterium]|nr:MarR family transcriptional regulator [Cytophagaceae bacterium]
MRLEDEIKQKEFKNEYAKSVVNLIYTFNWMDSQTRDFLKKYSITPQQFNILRILRGQQPNPATINLLKDRMLDKMCDASRMVERLKTKGLVDRQVCEKDRRAVDILITKKGLDLLSKIDKEMPDHEKVMQNLNPTEIKQLNQLLDKLRG